MRVARYPIYWSRERIVRSLVAFRREAGEAPTDSNRYRRLRLASPRRRRYPGRGTVLLRFPSMAAAWAAAGVATTDRYHWSELEDWYLREAAGRLPVPEIARDLGRTASAVANRLNVLGIVTLEAAGWTVNRVIREAGLPPHCAWLYRVVSRAVTAGRLPVVRNGRHYALDPADLAGLGIDWATAPPGLVALVRRANQARLVGLLAARTARERGTQ